MLDLALNNGVIRRGAAYLRNTPQLVAHLGAQPDLFLAWNDFGTAVRSIDVVLYFHGFAASGEGNAALSDFVHVSGLDLTRQGPALDKRTRPTLAIVPRGSASKTRPPPGQFWPYRFPALAGGGAMTLVSWCLDRMAEARIKLNPVAPAILRIDRLILMCHSGGGRGILDALPAMVSPPNEIFFFDALYQDAVPALMPWVKKAFKEDATRQGRLSVVHLSGTQTMSEKLDKALALELKAAGTQGVELAKRFKVKAVGGSHMDVPRTWAPKLLADQPSEAGTEAPTTGGLIAATTPDDRLRMARAIVKFEARRDKDGNLAIYELPEQDGGGSYEVAGINDRYNKEVVDVLVALIKQGRFKEAEDLAVDYIAQTTDGASSWSGVPAIEFYLRDSMFNRGPRGAARILQIAVGVADDGIVGAITRAAVRSAEGDVDRLLDALRQSRERYERKVVGRDESSIFWKGLVNRWNQAVQIAKTFPTSASPAAPAPAAPPLAPAGSLDIGAATANAMAPLPATMPALRMGATGPRVAAWQAFLRGQNLDPGQIDGVFGERTRDATIAFQQAAGLAADGVAGRETLLKAATMGLELFEEPADDRTSSNFPPRPNFSPLLTTAQREALFGHFDFVSNPQPGNPEAIRILGSWVANNIVAVPLPELRKALGQPAPKTVQFHRLAAAQLQGLWSAWDEAGLLDRVVSYDGSFVPRFIRGSRTVLSNHAFGSAFDINASFNPLGHRPALVNTPGSVRELVGLANEWGFWWGGHFNSRLDGMHFEIAFLKQ
jgi:peptidoglycan hydrolase-like protein with peptidoglycan-binding domain